MILVALGTEQFPFPRLLDWIDQAIEEGVIPKEEEVFIQAGNTEYKTHHQNVTIRQLIPYNELYKKYGEARISIVHAGIGTFLDILEQEKTPLLVPRNPALREHKDNHQQEFAELVQKELGIPVAFGYEEFKKLIANFAQKCKIRSTKENLVNFLKEQI